MFAARRTKKEQKKTDAFTDLRLVGSALPPLRPQAPSTTQLKKILNTRIHSIVDKEGGTSSRTLTEGERRRQSEATQRGGLRILCCARGRQRKHRGPLAGRGTRRRPSWPPFVGAETQRIAEQRYRPTNSSGASVEELSMLKSIVRDSPLSATPSKRCQDRLRLHEYDDESDDDSGRRPSLTRQVEQDLEIFFDNDVRKSSASSGSPFSLKEMEERMTGFRHEKFKASGSRSQPSADGDGDSETLSLVYDPDFGCYYNPNDDQYYQVVPNRM